MDKHFDVIVVGGGIPGLYAARELSKKRKRVLLIESSNHPEIPNYSTAGIPFETLKEFNIPKEAVNDTVYNLFFGTKHIQSSRSFSKKKEPVAVVLDFAKTKNLLAKECRENGAVLRFGERATGITFTKEGQVEKIKTNKGTYRSSCFIDATGSASALLKRAGRVQEKNLPLSVGMEYRILDTDESLKKYEQSIAVFFDVDLAPHGYAWIFSDGNNIYKVGIIEYWIDGKRRLEPLEQRLLKFLSWLGVKNAKEATQEIHGGSKVISPELSKAKIKEKNLYGIGDAIGAINPLFAEGIRQGLYSAKCAVDDICNQSEEKCQERWEHFKGGHKWISTELLSELLYLHPKQSFFTKLINVVDTLEGDKWPKLAFEYTWWHLLRSPYLCASCFFGRMGTISAFFLKKIFN